MKTRRARVGGRVLAVAAAALAVLSIGSSVLGAARPHAFLPEEKRVLLEREERLREETPVRAKPAVPERPSQAIPSDADWPEGIFEDGEFPSADYRFVNRWTGTVDGRHVTVYAGSYAADPARGLVLVMSVSRDLTDVEAREYPVPGTGPLRIVAQRRLQLALTAEDGARMGFDVVTRRFAGN
jgi:hypothetical protein